MPLQYNFYHRSEFNPPNFLKSNINKNNFAAFIAQFNGVIVGVIQGEIKKAYFTCNPALIGHCGTIFVKNEYRERGIATELFKSIVKWFKSKKVKTLSLYTHCKNNDAIDFWKNAGFKESMVLMKKVLR